MFSVIRRICIVNFTGERANWGCQATSWELLKFLNGALSHDRLPSVSFVPLLPRCRIDLEYGVKEIESIYDAMKICAADPGDAAPAAYLEHVCQARYGHWLESARTADLIVLQGEGTMTGTDFVRGARLLLLPFVAKQIWKKPVISLNQTLFICEDEFEEIAAAAFNCFDINGVREPISLDVARRIGIRKVLHVPDTAFLAKPARDASPLEFEPNSRYFCVTGTAFPGEDVHEKIFDIAAQVRDQTGLVPVVAASTLADRKLEVMAQKAWAPSSYKVVPFNAFYPTAMAAMSRCEFVMGGRYHMAIMAAAVGTPAVLVRANSFKNESLSALLDAPNPVRSVDDRNGILADALSVLGSHGAVAANLRAATAVVLETLKTAQRWLSAALRGQQDVADHTLETAPGRPIGLMNFIEPYRTTARNQAASLAYPDEPTRQFGRVPSPLSMLGPLLANIEEDASRNVAAIRQLFASDPSLAERCPAELKRKVDNAIARVHLQATS
jgi:polysaccharide pyruvyl transferase WcaK-like protein